MARAKKEYCELTVSEAYCYGRKTVPILRIQGLWFKEMEFIIGDPVMVKCEEGIIDKLIRPFKDRLDAWFARKEAAHIH